jgi:hypothetical protein
VTGFCFLLQVEKLLCRLEIMASSNERAQQNSVCFTEDGDRFQSQIKITKKDNAQNVNHCSVISSLSILHFCKK